MFGDWFDINYSAKRILQKCDEEKQKVKAVGKISIDNEDQVIGETSCDRESNTRGSNKQSNTNDLKRVELTNGSIVVVSDVF